MHETVVATESTGFTRWIEYAPQVSNISPC